MPMDPTRLTRPQPQTQPQHEVWPRDLVKSAPASSLGEVVLPKIHESREWHRFEVFKNELKHFATITKHPNFCQWNKYYGDLDVLLQYYNYII